MSLKFQYNIDSHFKLSKHSKHKNIWFYFYKNGKNLLNIFWILFCLNCLIFQFSGQQRSSSSQWRVSPIPSLNSLNINCITFIAMLFKNISTKMGFWENYHNFSHNISLKCCVVCPHNKSVETQRHSIIFHFDNKYLFSSLIFWHLIFIYFFDSFTLFLSNNLWFIFHTSYTFYRHHINSYSFNKRINQIIVFIKCQNCLAICQWNREKSLFDTIFQKLEPRNH